jgi:hypothetical protein
LVKIAITIHSESVMKRFQMRLFDQMFPIHVRMDTAIAD